MTDTTYRPDTRQLRIIKPAQTFFISRGGKIKDVVGTSRAPLAIWYGSPLIDEQLAHYRSGEKKGALSETAYRVAVMSRIPVTITNEDGIAHAVFCPLVMHPYYITKHGYTYQGQRKTMPIDQVTIRELNEQYPNYLIVSTDGRCRAFDGLTKICDVPSKRDYIPKLKAHIKAYDENEANED